MSNRTGASGNGKNMSKKTGKIKEEEKELAAYHKDVEDKKRLVELVNEVFKETKIPISKQQMEDIRSLIINRSFAQNTSYLQKMIEVQGYIAAYLIGLNINKI